MTADPLFAGGYYAATAHPLPPCPPLGGEVEADLVVVGAGFAGLACALRAAEHGQRVVVVEAVTPGHGASGRNGGQLIPGLRWDARTLIGSLGMERARALFNFAVSAEVRVKARIQDHGIACDLAPGHATMAWSASHYRDLCEEADVLARDMGYGDAIELVPADRSRDVVASDAYHGGMIDRRGGHFHPLNYVVGLAHAAVAAGVAIHAHSPAVAVREDAGGVTIATPGGTVRAAAAVLAVDTAMGGLDAGQGRFAMPIMNYNIATAPLGADRAAALIPSGAAIADTRFVLNYFRLSADHRLIFGGGEKYLPSPPADIDAFVRRHMRQVFPSLADVGIDYRWGGPVGVSVHRLPLVGRSAGGRVWHAHGFSGHGALLTTLAGESMADAMAGDVAGYAMFASLPRRPFPGGALMRWPLHVGAMLWFALRDRI